MFASLREIPAVCWSSHADGFTVDHISWVIIWTSCSVWLSALLKSLVPPLFCFWNAHTGYVLAECWILNCGPVHLNILLNLSWNGFVILEMKYRHSKGGENIRAALAVWKLQWLLLCGLMCCLFSGMPILFSMACFHVHRAQLCLLKGFCTSKSLLTMCLLYLGPKESLDLLKESWLHTLLGNMLRKLRLEEIIAGWI